MSEGERIIWGTSFKASVTAGCSLKVAVKLAGRLRVSGGNSGERRGTRSAVGSPGGADGCGPASQFGGGTEMEGIASCESCSH